MRVMVAGGAGFIGSALVRELLGQGHEVMTLDRLTYAACHAALDELAGVPAHRLLQVDIADAAAVSAAFSDFAPQAVMNLAAETHVDRSIDDASVFLRTNVTGVQVLLDAARRWLATQPDDTRRTFRFHQVSTDEVFGDLGAAPGRFHEGSPLCPSSPYAASKAAADHLVRAWQRTYGLPCLITISPNNYGPRQFPEKLIPHTLLSALQGRPLPVYGDGLQVRDWLHVEDHARALALVLQAGEPGRTYCIGADGELDNLSLVRRLCALLDELAPARRLPGLDSYAGLIAHVDDRPGHDRRYAVDAARLRAELGWRPRISFDAGLRDTVRWYLDHEPWWRALLAERYQLARLGLGGGAGALPGAGAP